MRVTQSDLDHMLTCAKSDFLALKGARLFVTGGTGYVGRWLLESICYANQMLDVNIAATVLSRNPHHFASCYAHLGKNPAINLIEGDVRDFTFPAGEFTHAVHAATDVIATNSSLDTYDVIVCGTRRVLDFCRLRRIKNVLLLSPGAVYGRIPYNVDVVSEEYSGLPSVNTPNSAYGIGKIVAEWLGNVYSSCDGEMACKSARVFAQVGPYLALDKQFAAGNFILNALNEEPFLIKGDGSPRRSYMYATDLVIWLWGILVRGQTGRAYNVGSDFSISIRDLATMIGNVSGIRAPKIEILGRPYLQAAPERYVPNITRAKDELGLKISVPLDEALRRTIEWYRSSLFR